MSRTMALHEGRKGAERVMQEVYGGHHWREHHGMRRAHARLMHGLQAANRIAPLQGASLTHWLGKAKPMVRAEALRGGAEADEEGEETAPPDVGAPFETAEEQEALAEQPPPDPEAAFDAEEANVEEEGGMPPPEEAPQEEDLDLGVTDVAPAADEADMEGEAAALDTEAPPTTAEVETAAEAEASPEAGDDEVVSKDFQGRLSKIHALLEAAPTAAVGITPTDEDALAAPGGATDVTEEGVETGGAFPMFPHSRALRKQRKVTWAHQQAMRGGSTLIPMPRPQGSQAALEALTQQTPGRTIMYNYGGTTGPMESVAGSGAPRSYY